MGIRQFRIIFDNPAACYYVGQTVSGRVILAFDSPKTVRNISIKIKGEAEVNWQEKDSRTDKDGKREEYTVFYNAEETYFENNFFLFGSANGESILNPGEYCYPFSCPLPTTLPSSFESQNGHIRYTAKVVVNRPWKFDHECKTAFTVVSPLDLNTMPNVKEPINLQEGKTFGCWCWTSGPLQLTVRLPASGYVPGQTIPFHVELENDSNVEISPVNCVLRKEVTYHAHRPHRKTHVSKTVLTQVANNDKVEPHSTKNFSRDIVIPAVPPSNLNNCSIIDLQYVFKVEAVASGCHSNLNVRIPITLGTIPLLSGPTAFAFPGAPAAPAVPSTVYPQPADPSAAPVPGGGWNIPGQNGSGAPGAYPQPPAPGAQPPAPAGMYAPSAPPMYPNLPPPTYGESVFGGGNIKDSHDTDHTQGLDNFIPKYPIWDFNMMAK